MPQLFTDLTGRKWSVAVTVKTIEAVRRMCEVDLVAPGGEVIQRLHDDPVLLCNVLFVVCSDQAAAEGVTDEQFGGVLGGDALEEATRALLEGVVGFFPKHRREAIRAAWTRYAELETAATSRVTERLASPTIDQAVLAHVDRAMDASLKQIATQYGPRTN
jgi:hypothetical protein